MLNNRTWQPLPGTRTAWIYPYIRRPDILSSNSFLIRSPGQLVIIDAGALPEQAAELQRVAAECRRETALPLVIFLTHCHLDHSLQAPAYQQNPDMPAWVAVHTWGAAALTANDPHRTAADLYGRAMPGMVPELSLFQAEDGALSGPRRVLLPGNASMVVETHPWPDPGPNAREGMCKLVVSLACGEQLEVYPTPGHTPDSVCIRMGEILFMGDLLAATYPLVAGIHGWNRSDLIHSLDRTIHLLETGPIRFCCPAHGGVISVEKASALLLRAKSQAVGLTGREEVTPEGLFQVMELALELVNEAEEVFSSLAGRLLYVAHHLDELEEPEAARLCRSALPMEQVDVCLEEIRTLCQALDAGRIPEVYFTHEALTVVRKINHLFDRQRLAAILPESLVNRASCLLLDFLAVARCTRNLEEYIPTDLSVLLTDLNSTWNFSPHHDQSILECLDDEKRYLAQLTRRIGHPPLARRARLVLDLKESPMVRVAAARLADTLVQFLEWLTLSDPAFITLSTKSDTPAHSACDAVLSIIPQGWSNDLTLHQEKKIASFARRLRIAGMTLQAEADGFRLAPLPGLA
jgi:glyoxylase-like metal-dependent hydrolase (beta-lactamase superfamily II)